MALRLMDGIRPNFSYPNSCYMYVTSKYAEDSKHDPHKALVPGVSLLTGSVTPSSIVAHCGAVSCLRKQYDDAANVQPKPLN